MKSNTTKFIEDVVNGFQHHKGKASVYCFTNNIIPNLIQTIVTKFRCKNPSANVFIVVDSYNTRQSIKSVLNDDTIKIISKDYIKSIYKYPYQLIITVGLNENFNLIDFLSKESKFTLCILTENLMNKDFITSVRKILPNIETSINDNAIQFDRIYSPVEEIRCGINLCEDNQILYDKYTEHITTSISIFGDLSNIEKCKIGDIKLNISGSEYRYMIAKENGWNETLDTSIEFQKQIDDIYNPNALYEKACMFYTISKQRRDLVTDGKEKLEEILDICKENQGKQILIVSKRGEFAREITKYLNNNGYKCGDYHDCIENMIAVDDNGVPLIVKSGTNKGKPKIVGSQYISTNNLRQFNEHRLNILSIKNSSQNSLKTAVDLVIFTSPLCSSIIELKQRFADIIFNGIYTKVYKIYFNNTIEYGKLNKEQNTTLIKIINKYDENLVQYDKNSGDIIL